MVDQYREAIEEARAAGVSCAVIGRTLGIPPSTIRDAFDRWQRPAKPQVGAEALEALRRLVEPA